MSCILIIYIIIIIITQTRIFAFIPEQGSVVFSNCSDGELRLAGSTVDYDGRVEVCINGAWGSVCYSGFSSTYYTRYWDGSDARVVCRQLGHQELGEYDNHNYNIMIIIMID